MKLEPSPCDGYRSASDEKGGGKTDRAQQVAVKSIFVVKSCPLHPKGVSESNELKHMPLTMPRELSLMPLHISNRCLHGEGI